MVKGRLEAFSDGVMAIIITIMVLELEVPHDGQFAPVVLAVAGAVCYGLNGRKQFCAAAGGALWFGVVAGGDRLFHSHAGFDRLPRCKFCFSDRAEPRL
jgi:hypothetical protein